MPSFFHISTTPSIIRVFAKDYKGGTFIRSSVSVNDEPQLEPVRFLEIARDIWSIPIRVKGYINVVQSSSTLQKCSVPFTSQLPLSLSRYSPRTMSDVLFIKSAVSAHHDLNSSPSII